MMGPIVIIDNDGHKLDVTNDLYLYPVEGARWSEDYWPAGDRWPRWRGYDVIGAAVVGSGDDEEAVAWALAAPLDPSSERASDSSSDHSSDHSSDCHPDCGPITARVDGRHAHKNEDGRCWHDDEDAVYDDIYTREDAEREARRQLIEDAFYVLVSYGYLKVDEAKVAALAEDVLSELEADGADAFAYSYHQDR